MLFDDLRFSESEFQRVGIATENMSINPGNREQVKTRWAWILKKALKIDMTLHQKNEFARQ